MLGITHVYATEPSKLGVITESCKELDISDVLLEWKDGDVFIQKPIGTYLLLSLSRGLDPC